MEIKLCFCEDIQNQPNKYLSSFIYVVWNNSENMPSISSSLEALFLESIF